MENVYVTPGTSADLEHALNRAMDARGIKVAEAPGEGPFTVRYFMTPVSDSPMVSITLMSVGAAVHEVSGLYNIAAASATGSATPAGGDEPMPILPAPGAAR
jgi:hypothetical protein